MSRFPVPFVSLLVMAAASLVGCSDTPAPSAADGAPGAIGSPAVAAGGDTGPVLELRVLNDWYRAVLINEDAVADPHDLEAIARPICEGMQVCRVGLWYDEADMPEKMPVREAQLRYQVFAFGRTFDGSENVLWNCNVFPEFEVPNRCLPRPMDGAGPSPFNLR
jgi:hypothetical protein